MTRSTDELERLAALREPRSLPDDLAGARAVRGSQLRLLESERGLERARLALERSRSLLARQRLSVGNEGNTARQQELAIAREMLASRTLGTDQQQ